MARSIHHNRDVNVRTGIFLPTPASFVWKVLSVNRYAHAEHFKIIELVFDAIRNLARELMLLRGREIVTCTSLSDDPVNDFAHKAIGSLPSLAVFLVRRHKFAP
jgi:hypothetical protein